MSPTTSYADLAQFGNYSPASIGWGGEHDPMAHPELLVPFSFAGASFGRMHRDAVPFFTAILTELVPLIPKGIAGDNDEGCYNAGSVTVGGDRSFHTYGIAIDINWQHNPMYAASRPTGPYALPPATSRIVHKYGGEWGGDWSYPQDWMHIECHLNPAQARAVKSTTKMGDAMTPEQMKALYKHIDDRFDALSAGLVRRLDGVITPLLQQIEDAVEPKAESKPAGQS
jgi:D-alanyl-D-alanine carboxypeptidase-like protein